jgi:hypothetical protein|tara:strand:- start:67 stop:483 length:417 start_codon:yes stop_codon:yes gene_type:complete
MATVNVTLSLSSSDLFAKQTLSFTETDALSPAGDQQVVGKIYLTGTSVEDSIHLKEIEGTGDKAYLYMKNLSSTSGEWVEVSRRASAVGTDSTAADWFAVLGPGEFLFIPIANCLSVDLRPAAGNPTVEYILMEKAAG